MDISRRMALGPIFLAPVALAGCTVTGVEMAFNTSAGRLRSMAAAMEKAIAQGVAGIQAAAPQIALDIVTACNIVIALNDLAQSAVSLGAIPSTKSAVVALNTLANSAIVTQTAAGATPPGRRP